MLTQQPSDSTAPQAPQPRPLDDLIAYFEGDWVPMRDAKVSIMTHAFMYGTATFEGIRGYWNAEQGTLYVPVPQGAHGAHPPQREDAAHG